MRSKLVSALGVMGGLAVLALSMAGAPPSARAGDTPAASVGALVQVDNFRLADQHFLGHELYRLADAKAVVLVTFAQGCATAAATAAAVNELRAKYAPREVEILVLNSALSDTHEAVRAATDRFGLATPVLMDTEQLVGEQLGVTHAGEMLVIDPRSWTVVYRGPIKSAEAASAVAGLAAGGSVKPAAIPSTGCPIDFPERRRTQAHAQISYALEIAPILEAKCVSCHQPGAIGPFSMTSYEMVKGFSPMIREVLRTKRMPPWGADPHVGEFKDSQGLAPEDVKKIVHWIEAGAPRGDGPDPLALAEREPPTGWPFGKPDLILKVPPFTIPATGVVDYQRPWIANPLTEGKWIRATAFKVDELRGVHHFIAGYLKETPKPGEQAKQGDFSISVGSYAPGYNFSLSPAGLGTYLPAGGAIGVEAHYTPFGREATDASEMGIYFYKDDEPPHLIRRTKNIVDSTITIPAGADYHKETAYVVFPKDALLYSIYPHAHVRGFASDAWIEYPDGRRHRLLAVPFYDFNWQREYTLVEPLKVPAGSKIIANYWYDNSKRNWGNPDASKPVTWGEQSWEEMLFTTLTYRWLDETVKTPVDYDQLMNQFTLLGMLDDNIDGKLQRSELKGSLGKLIAESFDSLDVDRNGVLEGPELAAMEKMFSRRGRTDENSSALETAAR